MLAECLRLQAFELGLVDRPRIQQRFRARDLVGGGLRSSSSVATTIAHPNISHLRRIHKLWTPNVLPMTERWFSVWQQSGLELDDVMLAATTSSMAIIGLVEEEQLF